MKTSRTPALKATPRNMKAVAAKLGGRLSDHRVCCYSPRTGECYSADVADYWLADPDEVQVDSLGNPCYLVRRVPARYVKVSL